MCGRWQLFLTQAATLPSYHPHPGSFFLPAVRLACVLRRIERQGGFGADWRTFHPNGSLEYYESLWLMPWLVTVLPLRTASRHMVHHLTDKYTRGYDVTMARPDAFLRAAANFTGSKPVTLLGARRRRPSKKLELELRELEAGDRAAGARAGPDLRGGGAAGSSPASPLS